MSERGNKVAATPAKIFTFATVLFMSFSLLCGCVSDRGHDYRGASASTSDANDPSYESVDSH